MSGPIQCLAGAIINTHLVPQNVYPVLLIAHLVTCIVHLVLLVSHLIPSTHLVTCMYTRGMTKTLLFKFKNACYGTG